jgi:hypothetical protein
MFFLKLVQWVFGIGIAFYLYKALLGKMQDGDGKRAGFVALIWFATQLITSGLIKIQIS